MKNKARLINAAITGLLTAGASVATIGAAFAADAPTGVCEQNNGCKGKGGCGGLDGKTSCKGHNSCSNWKFKSTLESCYKNGGNSVTKWEANKKG